MKFCERLHTEMRKTRIFVKGAANVLLAGAEKLKTSQNEVARNRTTPDFHIELLRLRQNWRLKKVSNMIIGDLSYRTAGSKFMQTGTFEVRTGFENGTQ